MVINISEGVCPYLFPKAGKIESGTDKRRDEGGFLTGTKKDLNENAQKETETKEISGI